MRVAPGVSTTSSRKWRPLAKNGDPLFSESFAPALPPIRASTDYYRGYRPRPRRASRCFLLEAKHGLGDISHRRAEFARITCYRYWVVPFKPPGDSHTRATRRNTSMLRNAVAFIAAAPTQPRLGANITGHAVKPLGVALKASAAIIVINSVANGEPASTSSCAASFGAAKPARTVRQSASQQDRWREDDRVASLAWQPSMYRPFRPSRPDGGGGQPRSRYAGLM